MKKYLHIEVYMPVKYNASITSRLTYNNGRQDTLTVWIEKNPNNQCYYNLIVPDYENVHDISYEYPYYLEGKINIFTTQKSIISQEQLSYEEKYQVKEEVINNVNIYYAEQRNKGNKLLVTFPGFINLNSSIQYPISWIKDVDCNKLAFLDRYLINGTYMLLDNQGQNVTEAVVSKIKNYCTNQGILEKDIVFFGTSKGGTISLNVGSHFPNATIISIVPQLDLDVFFNDTYIFGNFHKTTLGKYLSNNKRSFNINDTLKRINNQKQRCYVYVGETDYFSNSLALNMFGNIDTKLIVDSSHNEVINNNYGEYLNFLKACLNLTRYKTIELNQVKKYLNININYKKAKIFKQEIIIKENGRNLYKLYPPNNQEGTKGKFYNIVLDTENNEYQLLTTLEDEDFSFFFSDQRTYTPEEKERDEKYLIKSEEISNVRICLSERIIGTPQRILITFPGFGYHYKELQYPVSTLSSINNLENVLVLAFQDSYLIDGSYMQLDDNGYPIKNSIVMKIRKEMEKYNLHEDEILFFGASKGGTIALSYIDDFPKANYTAIVPQVSLEHFRESRPHLNGTLIPYFIKNKWEYGKELDIAHLIYKHPDTNINLFNGIEDNASNNGLFYRNSTSSNLNIFNINTKHNIVTNFTTTIWSNLLTTPKQIKTTFKMRQLSEEKYEFIELGSMKERDYSEIMATIDFFDRGMCNRIFSTPIAKLKGKEGIVNTFCNATIDSYFSDYSELLMEDSFVVHLTVYSTKNIVYSGWVVNEYNQKCMYNSISRSFVWM
ncbi:hypothetical protein [Lactococcus formosensis]|uniref:hypothetical protein n=1 Tax=Lactococcus formosensis TaxID=1281486 RepID=UPI0022DFA22C|nr:hypothetical protein [Lactococcus formosensis]